MAEPVAAADQDWELVRQSCAGNRGAFDTLVVRYEQRLYRTALGVTGNTADAEEVVQETFLRAFEHLDQFRGDAKFQTWLTQIVLNTARMKLRKNHAHLWESLDEPQVTDEGILPREVAEWRENPEQKLGRKELETLLHQALRGLPPGYREVVVLRDVQLLSTQETAELLGLSIANVKTRLLRARLQLRERLALALRQPRRSSV
ncbi:MAG: sigma-70 family RNA polymerase sigma factor [Acidobacteria bacterium]|nr:MAG: sigma-70 family RNA polymerase sigma factor [Acidobacteriota bacterium]